MYSPNVKTIPLNPAGALELGMCPCSACDVGWGDWSTTKTETCHDTCPYWKEYIKKKEAK
ncbi:MAG: hypothetical protein N2V78_09175 [Methanophagales archaeon]|nr:hypothetical protein [Methanophagales archaeon]